MSIHSITPRLSINRPSYPHAHLSHQLGFPDSAIAGCRATQPVSATTSEPGSKLTSWEGGEEALRGQTPEGMSEGTAQLKESVWGCVRNTRWKEHGAEIAGGDGGRSRSAAALMGVRTSRQA